MFDKAGDIHFDLPPSLGLEDAVQEVPDANLVYMKAEGVYTKIVKRARAEKFKEEKKKLDVISLGKKKNHFWSVPNLTKFWRSWSSWPSTGA